MATPFASRKYVDTSVAGLFDGVEYDSTNKRIIFKHGSTQKAYVDATAFIKDGMVSTVAIVTVPDDEEPSGVADGDYIKVTFNTDAGSDPIYIPLTDIFNPANYYDKTAADGRYVQKETGKGLSTEDYTSAEKTKLEGVEAGAQANVIETVKVNGTALTPSSKAVDISVPAAQVQSDWSQSDSTKKDFIKNKPTIPAAVTVDSALSDSSTNPVQNKVVKAALDAKANKTDLPYPFVAATVTQDGPWVFSDGLQHTLEWISSADEETFPLGGYWEFRNALAELEDASAGSDATSLVIITDSSAEPVETVKATRSNVLTITPRTVATYTADSSQATFSIAVGTGVSGAARDCVLVVDCTGAGAVAPTVTWGANFHPRGDAEEIAPVAGVRNVFYISEYAPGQFVVGGWHEEVA